MRALDLTPMWLFSWPERRNSHVSFVPLPSPSPSQAFFTPHAPATWLPAPSLTNGTSSPRRQATRGCLYRTPKCAVPCGSGWPNLRFFPWRGDILVLGSLEGPHWCSCLSCGVCCRGNVILHMSKNLLPPLAQEHAEVKVVDVSVHVDDLLLRTVVEVVIRPLFLIFPEHSIESKKTTAMLLRWPSASVEPRFTRVVLSSTKQRNSCRNSRPCVGRR